MSCAFGTLHAKEASKCHKGPESEQSRARAAFMKNLGAGTVAEALRLEMKKSWVQNWRTSGRSDAP